MIAAPPGPTAAYAMTDSSPKLEEEAVKDEPK